jgi:IS5 family transposase
MDRIQAAIIALGAHAGSKSYTLEQANAATEGADELTTTALNELDHLRELQRIRAENDSNARKAQIDALIGRG